MDYSLILLIFCVLAVDLNAANVITGGIKDGDPESQTVQNLVSQILVNEDHRSNSPFQSKLLKIENVTTQVVAGIKYHVVFYEGATNCRKNGEDLVTDLTGCDVTEQYLCTVNIWVQPWISALPVDSPENAPICSKLYKSEEIDYNTYTIQIQPMAQSIKKRSIAEKGDMVIGGDDHDFGNFGDFRSFMIKHNKTYKTDAETVRRWKIFRNNLNKIKVLNDNEQGDAVYQANHFADLTEEEFRKYYLTPTWDTSFDPNMAMAEIPDAVAPDSWDWRDHNAVTEVKNQGMCGSCWAFSTTGNVEGQWAMKNKKLLDLSEQELVDCDTLDSGCNGGLPTNAYQSIMKLGGLETESDYPYEGKNDKCAFKKTEAKVQINSYVNISSNEDDMKVWLFKNGPISVGINAFAMQFYFGGVSHPFSFLCNPNSLDHGVLIVGYGIKKGWLKDSPYWIVKNSWGASWGEKGYYLLYRGEGVCGINKMPTSAVIT